MNYYLQMSNIGFILTARRMFNWHISVILIREYRFAKLVIGVLQSYCFVFVSSSLMLAWNNSVIIVKEIKDRNELLHGIIVLLWVEIRTRKKVSVGANWVVSRSDFSSLVNWVALGQLNAKTWQLIWTIWMDFKSQCWRGSQYRNGSRRYTHNKRFTWWMTSRKIYASSITMKALDFVIIKLQRRFF